LAQFICRKNTGASILAEAILRHLAQGRVHVRPYALECLAAHQIATTNLESTAWRRFFGLGRPSFQLLITLCDAYAAAADSARDTVHTVKAHWPTPEPELVVGSPTDKGLAFEEAFVLLGARIRRFLALPLGRLSDPALSHQLARIGEIS
jgi:arsenate reductase (thioredoxin)